MKILECYCTNLILFRHFSSYFFASFSPILWNLYDGSVHSVGGGELFERIIDDSYQLMEVDAMVFVRQICEGIFYMHQMYVLHLDLKVTLCYRITCMEEFIDQLETTWHNMILSMKFYFSYPCFSKKKTLAGLYFFPQKNPLGLIFSDVLFFLKCNNSYNNPKLFMYSN